MHVDYRTKPEGMWMYEVGDMGNDGRIAHAAQKIVSGDFCGTIVGKHRLPTGTDKQYYLHLDEQYENDVLEADYYFDQLRELGTPTKIYDAMLKSFEQNMQPNDEFVKTGRWVTIAEYEDKYGELSLLVGSGYGAQIELIESDEQIDYYCEDFGLFKGGHLYYFGPNTFWNMEIVTDYNAEKLKAEFHDKKWPREFAFITGPEYDRQQLIAIKNEFFGEKAIEDNKKLQEQIEAEAEFEDNFMQ